MEYTTNDTQGENNKTTKNIKEEGTEQITSNNNNNNNNNNNSNNMTENNKPNRPTALQDIHGKNVFPNSPAKQSLRMISAINNTQQFYPGFRRQSMPVSGSTGIKLHPPSPYGMMPGDFEDYPGSPSRPQMTPLLTPALSVSSLVSSLGGSLENLDLEDEYGDQFDFDNDDSPNDPIAMATRKLHLTFAAANQKDIVNNRLKYFFNTLDNEEYFEKHSGKDFGSVTNLPHVQSPLVDNTSLRSFQETKEVFSKPS